MITKNVNGNDISQAFIDQIRSDSPDVLAKLMMDGSEIECDITDLQVFKGSCGSVVLTIGNVIADRLTASVKNLSVDLRNKDIECWIGAWTGSDYEFISMGTFTVSEALKTRYETQITAYSSVVGKTTEIYIPEGHDPLNPPTILELGEAVASQMGYSITFDSAIDTSQLMMVDTSSITRYQCLQAIAVCSGAYIVNDNAGDIYVKRFDSTPTLAVDTGMMVRLPKINEAPVVVESVLCRGDTRYSASIAELVDEQGRFISDELDRIFFGYNTTDSADVEFNCDYMTRDIFNANVKSIIGYSYWRADVGLTLGDPRLEGIDVLAVTDVDGSVYQVPCHQITHKYTGGFSSSIKSAEPTPKQNNIGSISPLKATQDLAYQSAAELKTMNQYFWFQGQGDDEGAHITQIRRQDFEADPDNGGVNLVANSDGITIREGLDDLAIFSEDGLDIYKRDAINTSIAHFGQTARIGEENDANISISPRETLFHGNNGELVGAIESGVEISGVFTEILGGKIGLLLSSTTSPVLLYSRPIAYAPLGNITININHGASGSPYSRTISSITDSDSTDNGFRIKYTASTRYLEIWWVSGYDSTYAKRLVWSTAEGYMDSMQDLNGIVSAMVSINSNRTQLTLTWTPAINSTRVLKFEFEVYDIFGGYWKKGTVTQYSTRAFDSWEYTDDDDFFTRARIKYDGDRSITILDAISLNSQEEEVHTSARFISLSYYTLYGRIGTATSPSIMGTATYDRYFLAPQYVFGLSNDPEEYPVVALFGEYLTAGGDNQTVIGRYNAIVNKAFCIGSGTSESYRTNAMEVDWNGNTTISGTLTQGSDRRLKEHIDYLDDDAVEFIRRLKPAYYKKAGEDHVGFYAQDVEEIDEWRCMTGEMNGFKTLNYIELIAPLVKYCQELEKRIEELERRD